jgi:hypothetical protein
MMEIRERTLFKLQRIACACSARAGKELHYLNDDLEPWMESNEDIKEYNKLLDLLAALSYY